jgi:predicted nucleic acid-binding protein
VSGFVIDASVALAWCFDDEATEATRALLDRFEDERAEVPSLWHLELANALAMGERNKRITPARASEFIALIEDLPIVIDERTPNIALSSVLELSRRERLSAYDASYLELAMRRGVPLATKDNDLARAANHMGVTLLPTV